MPLPTDPKRLEIAKDLVKALDDLSDGGFADPAERECSERNAELDGGKKIVHRALELEDGAGSGPAEGDKLLHAGLTDADERELGGDEEAVGQDEEGHHGSSDESPLEHGLILREEQRTRRCKELSAKVGEVAQRSLGKTKADAGWRRP